MAAKKRKVSPKTKSENSIKGALVEMIVASLHDDPNVKVERNVRLPALRNPKRKREIDVLISGLFAGYPVRIAVECKNYKSIIDIPFIDAYIGKLQDIGLPIRHGIFVSPFGFTQGALERAQEVGLTPLVLTGLTPDRLSEKIDEAIQSVVYLLLEITSLVINCEVERTDNSFQLWFLYDKNTKMQGSIPDLVWEKWIEGLLPAELGEHEIDIEIPEGWQLYIDDKLEQINAAKATVKVTGLLITAQGKASQHALLNPIDREVNRFRTHVSFDTWAKVYPLTPFSTEEDLQKFIDQRPEVVKLTIGHFRLPRIRFYSLYWPFSLRAFTAFSTLAKRCYAEGRKATNEEMAEIEGSDLKTIWDPLWAKNPILKGLNAEDRD
jgi:hypothetical protein